MNLLRRVIPWLFAALLLALLFSRYPLSDVAKAATQIHLLQYLTFLLGYFIYLSLADCWSLAANLNRFGISISVTKAIQLRMASNLVMLLNYGAGQGVLGWLISRHCHAPFTRTSGVLLFQIVMDLYLAFSISTVGTLLSPVVVGDIDLAPWIRIGWALFTVGLLLAATFIKTETIYRAIRWKTMRNLIETFRSARFRDYLASLSVRVPMHLATSTYLYFLVLCFGTHLPFSLVIALLPLTVAIGAIPITPSGVGTVQITAIYLFQDFLSGESIADGTMEAAELILGVSLLFTISMYLLKLVSGMMFYRFAMQEQSSKIHDGKGKPSAG